MTLLNYAKSIATCQRNWDETFSMPEEHIQYVLDVCTTMPTKQSKEVYSLVVITNRKLIDQIFNISYNPEDKHNTHNQNSQVRANLLLAWVPGPATDSKSQYLSIGISAGAAALAGTELGYKTGFCRCYIGPELERILKVEKIYLMLGIGQPLKDLPPRFITKNNEIIKAKGPDSLKEIKIRRLN